MKTRRSRTVPTLVLAAAAALLLNACIVTSIKPFYFKENRVEATSLLGTWKESDTKHWTLEKNDDRYLWRITDGDETTLLEATFFEFQDTLFFDFKLAAEAYGDDEDLLIFAVRTHSVARVRLESDLLHIEYPDYEQLEKALEPGEEPDSEGSDSSRLDLVHHWDDDDRVILTGSTAELQGFLAWCLAREGCLGGSSDLVTVLESSPTIASLAVDLEDTLMDRVKRIVDRVEVELELAVR